MASGEPKYGDEKHAPGGYYSGMNPIPNIQRFIENMDKDKKRRDAEMEAQKAQPTVTAGADVQDHKEGQPAGVEGTRKTVTDPTTGRQVQIEDVNADFMKSVENPMLSVPNADLGKETTMQTSKDQFDGEYSKAQDITAPPDPIYPGSTSDVPIHGEKTNILFHPTPSISYEPMFRQLQKRTEIFCIGVLAAIIILGKMFNGRLYGLIPLGICVSSGIYLWMKAIVRSGREHEWSSEQERGETATANLIPESVEWMNTLLGIVWGLINPDMFAGVADTLEDIMQASVPGVIENVRVAEINQGRNPLRILSLRALPDSHVKEMKDNIRKQDSETKGSQEAAAVEQSRDYYNIECSFAYHARPTGKRVSAKARNMHMQLVFYLGIKGLFGVPLPIWVELQGLVGTVRLRLQMDPEPPFLKALTFTFMGLPKVQAGCMPMLESNVNILNLPIISKFVNYSIATAAAEYVAPKSMTLDVGKMLVGDDIQKDVEALGIFWIRIHKATGLSKQDRRGKKGGGSDPYITVTFSKYGKPMYCTRVIQDDLNPVWEETCALLVTPGLIKADEQLSMELWDSDRTTADDIVGKVELSMQKLIQHPGKMYPHVSKLKGFKEGTSMPGELHWEVGYFGKPQFRPSLRTHGKDVNLPDALKDNEELQDIKGSLRTSEEDAVVHTPPDPLWPSGICSVIIHQIVNLELENTQGSQGNRKGREFEPARPSGETKEEESKKLPSSYCTILFNDELAYRTRAKVVSSKPIFNAGTERFIRDWRSAIVTVTVRDQRMREHDPILGVVPLKLSDILQTSSQVTRWHPLDGGIGFGRIRISLLFRSVETRLPLNQLGWDVGTFEFTSDKIKAIGYHVTAKLKMRTGGSTGSIGRAYCQRQREDDGNFWDIAKKKGKHDVRLPIKHRYRSPLIFEFHTVAHHSADAYAVLWLQHLCDNSDSDINIPIWKTDNGMRLCQNYITEANVKDIPDIRIEQVGRLQFRGRFKAGTDEDHEKFVSDNDSRETQEMWEACRAEGVRRTHVGREMPPAVRKLQEQSLTRGRDVLSQPDGEDKERWRAKDGTDWSEAFGEDPAKYADFSGAERRQGKGPDEAAGMADGTAERGGDKGALNERLDEERDVDEQEEEEGSESSNDLRERDETSGRTEENGGGEKKGGKARKETKGADKKDLHRKQRGLMQWKPMRNLAFAKDEAKFAVRKTLGIGKLEGREPGVESEY